MVPRPERPPDANYYERDRVELFSQGDLFRDVPLAYPLPANELLVDEAEGGGSRRFLSGPLEFGPGMLITPSCSLGAQGAAGYGHPVRTLVPLIPLAELVGRGVVKETALADLRRFDHLINYMYLPALDVDELEFSMLRASPFCTCRSRSTTLSSRGSVSRSSPTAARSSCNGRLSGSTQAGSRTISTRSIRPWTDLDSAWSRPRSRLAWSDEGDGVGFRREHRPRALHVPTVDAG
jgi:hypothetical protein